MIIARVAAIACFTALKWMLLAIAMLLVLLTIVQALRGDADAQPVTTIIGGIASAMAGLACHWVARRFETVSSA
jgi:hypothetical protein